MERLYNIYRIGLPDGRSYIGCTVQTVRQRFLSHVSKPYYAQYINPNAVQPAIWKYGADSCEVECLAVARGPANASETETVLIAQHGTLFPGGYNLRPRGGVGGCIAGIPPKPPKPVRDWIKISSLRLGAWPPIDRAA